MIAQMLLTFTLDAIALGVLAAASAAVLGIFILAMAVPVKLIKTVFGGE